MVELIPEPIDAANDDDRVYDNNNEEYLNCLLVCVADNLDAWFVGNA